MQQQLGPQEITVSGIPVTTHFAQVLVEADYRMKLIGIGLEQPPVRLKSYVDRANPSAVARNAMQRWYFVPDYERLRVSEDSLAMEILGASVKLIGEDELIQQNGARKGVARGNRASQALHQGVHQGLPATRGEVPRVRSAQQLHRPSRHRRVHPGPRPVRPSGLEHDDLWR